MPDLDQITQEILHFRDEREWAQFHTPQHLTSALLIEAAELKELMLWKNDAEIMRLFEDNPFRERLQDEIADVVIFALILAHSAGVDVVAAIRSKLKKNAAKYPVDLSRGNATKYDQLAEEG